LNSVVELHHRFGPVANIHCGSTCMGVTCGSPWFPKISGKMYARGYQALLSLSLSQAWEQG